MTQLLLLVQIGVAAWMVYEAIRAVTPVFPALQPVLVAAICYGLTFAPPIVLLVLNASALTAFLRATFGTPRPVMSPGTFSRMSQERKSGSRVTDLPPRS